MSGSHCPNNSGWLWHSSRMDCRVGGRAGTKWSALSFLRELITMSERMDSPNHVRPLARDGFAVKWQRQKDAMPRKRLHIALVYNTFRATQCVENPHDR